jgi:two-component system, LytTR family, response regulator
MPDKIRVIIIDDEVLARDLVRNYLNGIPDIELAGECQNGFEALKMVQELQPDLLFLDIQMPKIDGFELLEVLDPKPQIIFTTAFDQYAIRAFEMNAIDYLLKPFSKARLEQSLDKARKRLADFSSKTGKPEPLDKLQQQIENEKKELERIITRLGSKITVIPVDKIWFLESADDYVMIHSELGNHLKEKTMKYFGEHLPKEQFVRIHRSYILNISCIAGIELYEKDTHLIILKSGDKLRASAEGYKRLKEVL